MTAVPRDPMFWKRFSLAVHQQEKPAPSTLKGSSLSSVSEDVEKQEDWLTHKQANWRRQKACVWVSVISMIVFVVVLAILLIWLIRHGFFMDGQKVTFP